MIIIIDAYMARSFSFLS